MIRKELHTVRRPFFDCTSYRRPAPAVTSAADEALHLHAELTRPLPAHAVRYSGIKVALKLAA